MTTAHICIMAAIIVYLGAMIFVGYLCSKNNNDSSDFYLGGRKLGPLVTAMSADLRKLEDRGKKNPPLHTCGRKFYYIAILFQ